MSPAAPVLYEPRLRCYMNLMAVHSLPLGFEKSLEQIAAAGFNGVQFATTGTSQELAICRGLNLGIAASGRVNLPEEAGSLAERVAGDGYECATLHVGWGLEDDEAAGRIIESILNASERWKVPLYIETHRATICQDMWRTVNFVRRFPEMRFNGDFSHWYAGQEMVYGGFEKKLAFIAPVLERVRFMHGRIASPGCIQVAIDPKQGQPPPYLDHFRQLWTASFRGFLRSAEPHDFICFTPELLGPAIYYARIFEGREESDRWEQSLLLKQLAEECFSCARSS